ncbi:hypothetical protein PAPYR_6129 [Paratrimastix pyriformis]|uniref:Uncharacterized protein n=1 Tax=Paratrimastix pyriformis TaxID=342808 RepID=A0ABQ8UFX2_9EUKA|nr:hypothetical protein PAPYR_6129 [Paratrimastix pyriformis]
MRARSPPGIRSSLTDVPAPPGVLPGRQYLAHSHKWLHSPSRTLTPVINAAKRQPQSIQDVAEQMERRISDELTHVSRSRPGKQDPQALFMQSVQQLAATHAGTGGRHGSTVATGRLQAPADSDAEPAPPELKLVPTGGSGPTSPVATPTGRGRRVERPTGAHHGPRHPAIFRRSAAASGSALRPLSAPAIFIGPLAHGPSARTATTATTTATAAAAPVSPHPEPALPSRQGPGHWCGGALMAAYEAAFRQWHAEYTAWHARHGAALGALAPRRPAPAPAVDDEGDDDGDGDGRAGEGRPDGEPAASAEGNAGCAPAIAIARPG